MWQGSGRVHHKSTFLRRPWEAAPALCVRRCCGSSRPHGRGRETSRCPRAVLVLSSRCPLFLLLFSPENLFQFSI